MRSGTRNPSRPTSNSCCDDACDWEKLYFAAWVNAVAIKLDANASGILSGIDMQNIQHQLASSYTRHPCFQFDQPELVLDVETLHSFVRPYEAVRAFNSRLSKRQFESCCRQCQDSLSAIFESLAAQTQDARELVFQEELRAQCERLMFEELKHYYAATSRDFAVFTNPQTQDDALRLRQDQFYFGALSAAAVAEILSIGTKDLARFRENAVHGRVTRDELSANSGPAIRHIVRVLNNEFKALGVLDAVSAYAGSRMSVTGLALELSVPQSSWWSNVFEALPRAPQTLYAHVDEAIRYPKSIVYLTQVTEKTGPTSCYKDAFASFGLNPLQELVGRVVGNVGNATGSPLRDYYGKKYHQSMSSARFRQHFMRLPAAMRFNSHLGWDVCPGSELEQSMADSEQLMLGAPGTFLVFDGARLLHRGGMVQEGERIALQVVFSNATPASRVLGKIKRALT